MIRKSILLVIFAIVFAVVLALLLKFLGFEAPLFGILAVIMAKLIVDGDKS